jgi:hypothetical protein
MQCPNDPDGAGGCGRPTCPICHPKEYAAARLHAARPWRNASLTETRLIEMLEQHMDALEALVTHANKMTMLANDGRGNEPFPIYLDALDWMQKRGDCL